MVKNLLRSTGIAVAEAFETGRRRSNPPLGHWISLPEVERIARTRMDPVAWDNYASGNADDITLGWNRAAFDRIALQPRYLGELNRTTSAITLFGDPLPFPILLAPTGLQRVLHPQGESATAAGAGRYGMPMVVSSMSTTPIEDIARIATASLWFQLSIDQARGFTREQVQRAADAGCKALCVTVDTPSFGPRDAIARAQIARSSTATLQSWLTRQRFRLATPHYRSREDGALSGKAVTWADVAWLRSVTALPIVLKGVLHPADARAAAEGGIDGLIVSNHGGRNLDTSLATLDALPGIVAAAGDRCVVMLDGGVRRGTDIVKALALGARAVMIGRPYLYGLTLAGADGVARVIELLQREYVMAMALTGQTDPTAVDPEILFAPSTLSRTR